MKLRKLFQRTIPFCLFSYAFLVIFLQLQKQANIVLQDVNWKRTLQMGIYEQSAGYGNRVNTLLSAMTIAILTERRLFIGWPESVDFIQEPFPDCFKYPNSNSQNNPRKISPNIQFFYKKEKDMRIIMNRRIEYRETALIFDVNFPYFYELCSNPYYFDKLLRLKLVRPETVENAREVLSKMTNKTSNSELVDSLFLIGKSLYKKICHLLECLLINFTHF